ncbi:MAG: hypothetical protein ACLUKN_08580 [Bacilli bacterium]
MKIDSGRLPIKGIQSHGARREKLADSLCAEFGKYLGASPSVLGLVGAGTTAETRSLLLRAFVKIFT